MGERVTVGLQVDFPVDSVVELLLDPAYVERWLGPGAWFDGTVGGKVVVPVAEPIPACPPTPAGEVVRATTATVQHVNRSHSSFALRAAWDEGDADAGLIVRVTTRPGGKSRIRITQTGVPRDRVGDEARLWSGVLSELGGLNAAASAGRRHYRQAIVVVHGIGEQRQNVTLRNFVDAVFPDVRGTKRFVKPDYVSPLVGANSVTVPGRWTVNRPTTDVYELYWAHLIRGTTVGEVYAWALRLLLAPRRNISAKLRPHVYVLRGLTLLVTAALAALLIAFVVGGGPRAWVTTLVAGSAAAFALIPGIVWKVGRLLGSPMQNLFVANILGDAARYLDSSPANVQVRQTVRESGLQLLNELHDRGRYGRIILYGHSLGSVIAYDILAHAWTRRSRLNASTDTMRTPRLRAVEDLLNGRDPLATPDVRAVRERQYAAWREFTDNGFEWLVSDLVTAGSPLTHARWLLNPDKSTSFDQLVVDRSMPSCPPTTTDSRGPRPGVLRKTFTFTHSYRAEGDDGARSVLVPDHGAMFALVRWSNVFFPHTGVMRGDPVGGPLRPTFGDWVDDVALPAPAAGLTGFAHTRYVDLSGDRQHVNRLREALDLAAPSEMAFWIRRAEPDESE